MSDINPSATPAAQNPSYIRTTSSRTNGPGLYTSQQRRWRHALPQAARISSIFLSAAMTPGCTTGSPVTSATTRTPKLPRIYRDRHIEGSAGQAYIRFRERDYLTFPLLSDADLTVHRLYGAYGEKKLYGKV